MQVQVVSILTTMSPTRPYSSQSTPSSNSSTRRLVCSRVRLLGMSSSRWSARAIHLEEFISDNTKKIGAKITLGTILAQYMQGGIALGSWLYMALSHI